MLNKSSQNAQHPLIQKQSLFLLTITLMSMAGLVGSDVYLPMLPIMSEEFSVSTDHMQLTLTFYLLGLSVGQLLLGILTQCYGRKKILIICMLIFCTASISCAIATSFVQLIVSRVLQAFGACAGLVIGRAIIGDVYSPQEAGKAFATVLPFVGMSPAISPAIGGFIGSYYGWESNFFFISLFAFGILLLTLINIPETLASENRKSLNLSVAFLTYPKLLSNPLFLFYVIAPCGAYVAYFAYLAQSPFILHAQGFTEQQIGLLYITLSLTYVTGSLYSKRCLANASLDVVINKGFIIYLFGAVLFLLGAFLEVRLLLMIIFISLLTFGNGFLIPLGTAGVVSSFPKLTGYASGLLGFLQLGLAGLTTAYIGIISQNEILYLAEFIFVVSIISTFIRWTFKIKKLKWF